MAQRQDKIAIQFRCDEAYNERLERHAADPRFGDNKAQFVRFCTGVVMDLIDINGPSFDLVVAGLRQPVEPQEQAA